MCTYTLNIPMDNETNANLILIHEFHYFHITPRSLDVPVRH